MLIHLAPTFCAIASTPTLVDVHLPELNLTLREGHELVARRPYPNKAYRVACRRLGTKAIVGFLVDAPDGLREFTVISRWAVDAQYVAIHRVQHSIQDHQHGCVSQLSLLWHAYPGAESRWPEGMPRLFGLEIDPMMEDIGTLPRKGICEDRVRTDGFIEFRREVLALPSLEVDRLHRRGFYDGRMPLPEQALASQSTAVSG